MKTILLTGATGIMGNAGLIELYKNRDIFSLKVLARYSRKNKKFMQQFPDVAIIWGDLRDYYKVLEAVTGVDFVLHVGGMVSPKADYKPKTTFDVNVNAAKNIVNAVNCQPNADEIKVVYIGSVSQTSDRNAPIHWGRAGDPICISVYDHYAISKTIAERIIVEGVKNWVCLRQSGILYGGILRNYDPILFHVPLNGVLEWATIEDSGRLLANVCEENVPKSFWNNFYNIGSGDQFRITNYEFYSKLLSTIHCPEPEKIFETKWFALRNFHGHWYADSDKLNDILHFRENISLDDYFIRMGKTIPWFFRLAKIVPPFVIKYLGMMPLAYHKKMGTMGWMKSNNKERITAFFGNIEKWKQIPSWDNINLEPPQNTIHLLDHGYDENKQTLDINDIKDAAKFRGGECLSTSFQNFAEQLEWRCHCGNTFTASANLILKGGHWCPECLPPSWNYNEIAKANPFFAQVWHPLHDKNETETYSEEIYANWEK